MNLDIDALIVGLSAAFATVAAVVIGRRSDRKEKQVEAGVAVTTGVLGGYEGLTSTLFERLEAVERRVEAAEGRAAKAERALTRAQFVITLLVAQLRDLGHEPDIPAHLIDDLPTDARGGTP